ncbi:MAG TPA: glycosyltransferase family 4 protein [Terracidiphilus sp.]|nr:glycosyltransferase family 4 protein [Terracidiphilus sp.]
MKVIISSGLGKLHFHETVRAAALAGVDVEFIAGWIPSRSQSRWVDALGHLLGEVSLASRMQARIVDHPRVTMRSNALAEFGGRAITFLLKPIASSEDLSGIAFAITGARSRKWLHDADIFQVRSGAGQGGAICTARAHGMRVLTDHSIAHPAYVDEILGPEHRRLGLAYKTWATDGLWTRVLRDCHDADRLLVNSDFVKRTFVERGFSRDRIDVAYLGVKEQFFSLKKDYSIKGPVRLLFTGNFGVRKGVATLLESVRILRRRGLEVHLRLVGNLSDGSICLRDSDSDFFTHRPFVPPEHLSQELAEADLFVFPTLVEGSSRSAMEAAAAGLPIVTTENCGLPLRAEKQEVVYVPLSNPDALATAVSELASDEQRRSEIGRNAASHIQRDFTWPGYGTQLMQVYSNLLRLTENHSA